MGNKRLLGAMVLICTCLMVVALSSGCGKKQSEGEKLYDQAKQLEDESEYSRAEKLYKEAEPLLLKEGDDTLARKCRENTASIQLLKGTYPLTEGEVRKALADAFPDVPKSETETWISEGELENVTIDGKTYYFEDIVKNIKFRNIELIQKDPEMLEKYQEFFNRLEPFVQSPAQGPSWQPYRNPASYSGTARLAVPRGELPEKGELEIWLPLPVLCGPQDAVSLDSISPDRYLGHVPTTSGDIGGIYLSVDLDTLKEDLDVTYQFDFTHFEQRFEVDPEKVGDYDKKSAVYKEYTVSRGNTEISSDIRKKAQEIVGGEKNPYIGAKKIYDYVVENVKYSHMPHASMWPRGEAESVYVHNHKFGDCGAQSMYFSSLCRAVGIPARCQGGFQLIEDSFGTHFWAEFLIPGYGWLPVDTSMAQMADYIPDISEQKKTQFHDYFFGNQDNLRCVVQKDVDLPFVPPASEFTIVPIVLQSPQAVCTTMDIPEIVLNEHWSMELTIK